jgi:hypothetical protein
MLYKIIKKLYLNVITQFSNDKYRKITKDTANTTVTIDSPSIFRKEALRVKRAQFV